MKRQKPKSFPPGPFQAETRNRRGKAFYVCDQKLLPRTRQILIGYRKGSQPGLDELVDYLRERYGEYRRKKKSSFRVSVQKVYQQIKNESAEERKLQELEERFLGKRKDPGDYLSLDAAEEGAKSPSISSDSEWTDHEMTIDYHVREVIQKDENLVNESMHEMYRSSNSRRNSEEEKNEETLGTEVERKTSLAQERIDSDTKGDSISVSLNSVDGEISKTKGEISKNEDTADPTNVPRNGTPGNSTTDITRTEDILSSFNYSPQGKNKRELDIISTERSSAKTRKSRRSQDTRRKKTDDLLKDDADKIPSVPNLRFSDVGGCGDCIQEVCKLLIHIKHPEVFKALGITPPRGFLLHGPPGCGKTLLAHAIAGELDVPLVNVASTEMVSGVSGESEGKIRDLFARASAHAPCVLFLDEIDAITPKRETASKEMERRIVAQLLSCLDELNRNQEVQVVVIGATNRPDSLDPALRRAGRFDREIRMGIPDELAREQILQVQCKDLKLSGEFDFKALAQQTPGFVGADLMALAREAAMCAVTRIFHALKEGKVEDLSLDREMNSTLSEKSVSGSPSSIVAWLKSNQTSFSEEQLRNLSIEMGDFTKALQEVQPSAKREGFATIPDVTWDDIGALEDIREELTMAIIAPVRHRDAFTELGLTNPPGILLAGPPGCGKTLLAKAIANESGINFISVKGPELLNMYVGESERAVRQVFQRARNSAPCVIFFDELDALCPRRSDSAESNASARVVNQLLTEMDGLETRKQVFIMGATNRPDIIDPAILRPGRLDKILYVGLPREADRLAILQTLTKRGTKPKLLEDVDLSSIAADERCHGFSGADLAALVREAAVNSLRECMKKSSGQNMVWEVSAAEREEPVVESPQVGVSMRHFDQAFRKIQPSVSEKEQLIYKRMKERMDKEN